MNLGDLTISSPAFKTLENIPEIYTGAGKNISPPLEWSRVPSNTKEFALVCFDPDAPVPYGFDHWVIYGIPSNINGIEENQGNAYTEGVNSTGHRGYTGPSPPQGHGPHHYFFWLYSLDTNLNLKPGLTRIQLMDAIAEHIIEQARIVGIYESR